jgi:hypothetical protein
MLAQGETVPGHGAFHHLDRPELYRLSRGVSRPVQARNTLYRHETRRFRVWPIGVKRVAYGGVSPLKNTPFPGVLFTPGKVSYGHVAAAAAGFRSDAPLCRSSWPRWPM